MGQNFYVSHVESYFACTCSNKIEYLRIEMTSRTKIMLVTPKIPIIIPAISASVILAEIVLFISTGADDKSEKPALAYMLFPSYRYR